MEEKLDIPKVRQRIDQIDDTILELLKERLDCAKTIGLLKNETNRAKWDPQRELEIYDRLRSKNNDIFPYKALHSIFHEIITTCRLSQRKATVAYLGPEATFTHLAWVKYFGQSAEYQPMESIAEVFEEVEKERVQYGIIRWKIRSRAPSPIPWTPFFATRCRFVGKSSWPLRTTWSALGQHRGYSDSGLSFPALGQCRNWLRKNLPQIPTLEVFSTGAAAQMAANNPISAPLPAVWPFPPMGCKWWFGALRIIRATPPVFWSLAANRPKRAVATRPRS
jgi:chorismate mutase/prephenate dehydratase